jgi:ClpP class serine protease
MKEAFINKLISQPMSIERHRARTIIASIVQKLRAERPSEDKWGDPLPKMQIVSDVAIVPVFGPIAIGIPDWVKSYGVNLTDVDDVAEELTQANNDPRVALTVLNFDSPGGWTLAGQKLFDHVAKLQKSAGGKPILAWCADGAEVGSAAYHGAMPATRFYTGRYALAVGCIGTFYTLLDDTEWWKMMGITIEVLRSGDLKGMGLDGYSEAQKAWLQSEANAYGTRFRKDVARYRTELSSAEMEGQFYDGEKAAALGFTHDVMADLPTALAKFRKAVTPAAL